MIEFTKLQQFVLWLIPTLFAITFHEVAHGYMALRCGDRTAQMLGRLSLNPVKHIDPVGTLLIPGLLFFLGGFMFGWAKPVPVTWQNFKNRRTSMALVAVAGPFANLIMAIAWGLVWKGCILFLNSASPITIILSTLGQLGILINLVLMILNLLPIPPLDGARIISSFLPGKIEWQYNRLEPYGFMILLALLATGILNKIMAPAVFTIFGLLAQILQLPLGIH